MNATVVTGARPRVFSRKPATYYEFRAPYQSDATTTGGTNHGERFPQPAASVNKYLQAWGPRAISSSWARPPSRRTRATIRTGTFGGKCLLVGEWRSRRSTSRIRAPAGRRVRTRAFHGMSSIPPSPLREGRKTSFEEREREEDFGEGEMLKADPLPEVVFRMKPTQRRPYDPPSRGRVGKTKDLR